jgi:hypothetical protein
MRCTLVALLSTLGLSACGGVVEEEPPAKVEEDTHSALSCLVTEPMCPDIEGTSCSPDATRYCCQDGYWRAKCYCWKANGYRWVCEQ